MTTRDVYFNGIQFNNDIGVGYTFIFDSFDPNSGTTRCQTDTPVLADGDIISNIYYETRVVNISGTIVADSEKQLINGRQALYKACDGKTLGMLEYSDNYNCYFTEAIADLPTVGAIEGNTQSFNVNFNLPNFYWKNSIYNSMDLRNASSYAMTVHSAVDVLPTFTINIGNVPSSAPTITITHSTSLTYGDAITHTITIPTYNVVSGEVIKINCEAKTVTSSVNGDIIDKTEDFSDFVIPHNPESGTITMNVSPSAPGITGSMIYYDKYIGV